MDQIRDSIEREQTGTAPARRSEFKTFIQLLLIATSGSTLVAVYILWIGILREHKTSVDMIAQSALYAAKELSQVYVDSSSFGRVGLCDSITPEDAVFDYGQQKIQVEGINTIYQTLKLDASIAKKLNRPIMTSLIEKDLEIARKLEVDLAERLHAAAEPDLVGSQASENSIPVYSASHASPNNIYRDVYRMLASDKTSKDGSLIEVRLKLGRSKGPLPPDRWPTGMIRALEPSSDFEESEKNRAPYVVEVEAVFQSRVNDNSGRIETMTKKSCAIISAPRHRPVRSTLVLNFPDGLPPLFDSAMSILNHPKWANSGDWQQAVGNEVPGKGSLAPSLQPVLPGMTPADAFSIALYHWLKRVGPQIEEDRLLSLLRARWTEAESEIKTSAEGATATVTSAPNSCLAIDTGARQYAIMNQTGPLGIGQAALSRVFAIYQPSDYLGSESGFPPSALPLFVDHDGNCNLAGRVGYDKEFVNEYLKALYETNLAAVESLAVAKMVIARATSALTQADQKIFIERQELNSVINRANRLGRESAPHEKSTAPDEVSRQIVLANEKIEGLASAIAKHEAERKSFRRTNALAILTTANATRVAASTYELCAHAFKLCKEGIFRINEPDTAYVISRKFVFTPCPKPVDESEFFKSEDDHTQTTSNWFKRDFDVVTAPEIVRPNSRAVVIGGHIYESAEVKQKVNAVVIFLTTDALVGSGEPKPLLSNTYPFANIHIPSGQLFYYCQDAVRSGGSPKVSWSVVIRDLVASRGQAASGKSVGDPIAAEHGDWCKSAEQPNGCPGLACEFQLRTPLPVVVDSSEASLTNPTNNAQIPEVPPMPAEML